MPASATGTSDDAEVEEADLGFESAEPRGFRKRWAKQTLESERSIFKEDLEYEPFQEFDATISTQKKIRMTDVDAKIPVVDSTVDELVEPQPSKPSSSSIAHGLERNALLGTEMNVFKYPWEKGRLAKIFGSGPLVKPPSLKLAPGGVNPVQVSLDVGLSGSVSAKAVVRSPVDDTAIFMQVVRKMEDVVTISDKQQKRETALHNFWELLSLSICSSTIGLKVTVEANPDNVHATALKILDAVFAVKSPGTLSRRMYSLQSFNQWCIETYSEYWIPVSEMRVWQYVQYLKQTGAAPTKATSLLEAMRFAWYLLGVHGADEAERSLRVKGISAQMKASKRPWRPADLFTLDEVVKLHSILENPSVCIGDRVMTGHILHLIYSRSRWSDLCNVSNLYVDHEQRFLELATRDHKGARSAELKSKLLPLVAPCKGVTNELWALTYLKVRKLCNLQNPGDDPEPMMRAPLNLDATEWSKRPLTSEEGAEFIRRILGAPKTTDRRLSTHSCKSTMISWTAKYGLSDHMRAVLARHMSCVSATTAVYSRDLLSPVLRELENMLQAIRCSMFHPDRSRSGMITPSTMPVVPGTPFAVPLGPLPATPAARPADVQEGMSGGPEIPESAEVEQESEVPSPSLKSWADVGDGPHAELAEGSPDSETSEEDSVQSTSDSEGEEIDDRRTEFLEPRQRFYLNQKSLVIHCERTVGVLKCGRRVSPHFVELYELNGIRCSRCFDI